MEEPMRLQRCAISLFAIFLPIAASAHKINAQGGAVSLQTYVEDPSIEANEEVIKTLGNLPLSDEDRSSFSVILRPSSGKNWPVGYNISACFFSSTSNAFRSAFEAVASEWFENIALSLNTRSANGGYNLCENGQYEVRVGNFGGIGSFSNVGKTRRSGPYLASGEPNVTLNIDFGGTSGALFRFLVLHETGHMLGIEHEHQNGNSKCRFKEEAVYAHYTPLMPGNNDEQRRKAVKFNILDRFYDIKTFYITPYDPNSVMIYFFPAAMYQDQVAAECAGGQPDRASEQDMAGIETIYKTRAFAPVPASLDDIKTLARDLLSSALPDQVKADVLARALREHPVSQPVLRAQEIGKQSSE
jgi:hypothetical protein